MAGSAKFATDQMREFALQCVEPLNQGAEGPMGYYNQMTEAGSIPAELPCEAYGIWDAYGQLMAAKSWDKMNAWYFHVDVTDLPFQSLLSYEAQDDQGNDVAICESTQMAQFIEGQVDYFFINGERFTLAGDRSNHEDESFFPLTCTGSAGRGAIATFDSEKTGVSIHFYSTAPPVRTEERMGCPRSGPEFSASPVDPRGQLLDQISKHSVPGQHPFWVTGNGA